MTDSLTSRQTQILKTIIDEYIETAEPVGSDALDKKYNLGVSPATIRNEMVALTKSGYLRQPHTSAGRIPSPLAMKFYINQLMEEKQMSLVDEVKAKEEVWDSRDDIDELMDEATHALASRTRSLAIAALKNPTSPNGLRGARDRFWQAGHSYVFNNPEFAEMAACQNLFSIFDEFDKLDRLFFGFQSTSPLEVLFGEELGMPELATSGIISTHFSIKGKPGALGVIGPARADYASVIPILRYFGNLIEEVANQ
ncbi:MAG: Transcriptional regulator of heat shock protein [Microgenomates group bacterium GW2011_GWC1_39_7b]|uniref:Heat-inducible transcription repressor HrcA n=3 Tax=Candidatus Woeseibacteriota TaxID=1752722 RepID=A0A0G0LVU3_9BACT|nr:MAG: Transcriptional regulator of heat shock protein [Candidatus Woesebacteria bacterium GW2011_GWB1_39_10]KKR26840.1 MAG: Transcriptional regulator of heat shock protein [Microgenomates group bacterium GW2011_GWC1_39_7b]KKS91070.1 MAG: Transcriptional regulator of heat shock protein [Candidatus Woesebacteria bacterium GW2011_GWA1_43_12]